MSTALLVYLLTPLPGIVVILTRVRLGGAQARSGRLEISRLVLNTHTVVGLLAGLTWIAFLLTGIGNEHKGNPIVGVVALAMLWVTAVAGLMILARWLRPRGKRAAQVINEDGWGRGPGLSLLAHLGLLAMVLVFTWAYLVTAV
ncbi:hypothetical protein [Nocardioides jiangxiensis]|uniref:DUF2269 family protein n=1 Tax=Nocardioides jiangxiensis TaxID=3064524 RepID=A0ABT9B3H4_9ACTN|nr:hypothetical protein [Nocardioides sp. WY-20]MDO7868935.1 hypothetical protein [Nocardioides sp. WY-20]